MSVFESDANAGGGKKKRALVRLQSCRPGPPGATMAATHESLAMLAAVRALDLDGVVSDVEIEETRAALRDAREMLANPLAYPPREEKDRAVVRQGAVEVRGREVRLGALDIENALVLRCVGVARSHRSRLGRRANVPPERLAALGRRPDARRDVRFSARFPRTGALGTRQRRSRRLSRRRPPACLSSSDPERRETRAIVRRVPFGPPRAPDPRVADDVFPFSSSRRERMTKTKRLAPTRAATRST